MRLFHRYLAILLPLTAGAALVTASVLLTAVDGVADRRESFALDIARTARIDQLERRATDVGEMLAVAAGPALLEGDAAIAAVLSAALRLPDIADVGLLDRSSGRLHRPADRQPGEGDPVGSAIAGGAPGVLRGSHAVTVLTMVEHGAGQGLLAVSLDHRSVGAEVEAIRERLATYRAAQRSSYALDILFALGALLALAAAVAAFAARSLARPIRALAAMAASIGVGTYRPATWPAPRQDELGDLHRALERTAGALRRTTVSRDGLDEVIGSLVDGLLVVDQDGLIDLVNPAASELLGWERARLVGCPIERVLPDWPALPVELSGRAVLVTRAPLRHVPGAVVLLLRDISEWRRHEAELLQARDAAEAANRLKTRLLANMSHELRTPLNAILGFSEVMAGGLYGALAPRYQSYANDIHASGQHLLEVINGLLDLSKIESGAVAIADTELVPYSVLTGVVRMLRGQAKEAGVELVVDAPRDLPIVVADARMLRQIMVNLVSNAIKFTPHGGRVVLRAVCHPPPDGLSLSVVDSGVGIAPEDLPRVMQPFIQTDAGMRRGGTGLGLSIARAMAELHGGQLALSSKLGGGTVATLKLPAERLQPLHSGAETAI